MAKKKESLSFEERLEKALLPDGEQPYKVPENWVWTRLEIIAEIITGGTPSKKNDAYYGGDFPFVKPADLDQGRYLSLASEYLTEEGKNVSRVIRKGSTSVCCIGTIGKSGYLMFEATTNQQINSIIPFINDLYVYYLSCSEYFVQELWKRSSATTISIVNKSKMSEVEIPLPPLAEQQRIVDRIESLFFKLDEAKEKAQNSLDSFEKRKDDILHKAFTGELTSKWREENGVSLDSWEETTLGLVCQINPKRVDTKNIDDSTIVTFVPMPSVSDVLGEIVKPLSEKLQKVKKGYTNFCTDDVIFAKITPCMENGKSAVVGTLENNIGFGSTEFHVIRCNANIFNRYIYHLVRWKKFRDEAKAVMTGAVGQQRVPTAFLEEYPLNLPTFDEQIEIVRILDNIFEKEQQAKELANIIEKIGLMKKAILTLAFRGELGTNDPEEESAVELLREILEVKS